MRSRSSLAGKLEHVDLLIFCDDPGIGGAAIVTTDLAVELARCGHKIAYIAPAGSNDLAKARSEVGILNFDISQDFATSVDKKLYSCSEIREVLAVFHADRILFSIGAYFSSIAAMDVLSEGGMPYSVWLHLVDDCSHTEVLKSSDRIKFALHSAHHIVTVSDANAHLLRQILPGTEFRLETVPNGRPQCYFDPVPDQKVSKLRHLLGLSASNRIALMVARYEPRKGYDRLIEAVRRLSDRGNLQNLHIVAIGADPANLRSAYKNRIQSLGLAKYFTLLGPQKNPRPFYGLSDFLVLPSAAEGMPLTVSEAMAQGKPVIASAVSGIMEQLGETNTLLPDPNADEGACIDALAVALERHVTDAAYAREMGKRGKARAQALFSMPAMVDSHRRLLELIPKNSRTKTFPVASAGALNYGEIVDFGNPESTSDFRIEGWSDCEAQAIWSVGPRATLQLPLPKSSFASAEILLELGGFVPPGSPPLTVTISTNGRLSGSFTLHNSVADQAQVFQISGLENKEQLRLDFELDPPRSPASYGLGTDTRLLGIQLQRLAIFGKDAAAPVGHMAGIDRTEHALSPKGQSLAMPIRMSVPMELKPVLAPFLSVLPHILDPKRGDQKRDLFTQRGLALLSSPVPVFETDEFQLPLLFIVIYFGREDLRALYDIQTKEGRRALLRWCILHGIQEHGLLPLLSVTFLDHGLRSS